MASDRYYVIRFFASGDRRIIRRGLTLAEAQAHCRDPETSSRTCTLPANTARTKASGPWFDGYGEER